MSDGIEALSEVARDADAARERMAELLREKGPRHVEALERRIERELDEVNESIQRKRRAVEEEVEYVIRKYGPEASAEEREEAARQVVRGFGSDLFTEAMRDLRARAEEATESSRRAALGGRHGHARRLVRTLYQKKDERDDLKFRLGAVQRALRAWAAGELDEEHVQPVEDRPDARVRHKDNEAWTVRCFRDLQDSGQYATQSEIVAQVQQAYRKRYGKGISSRTVLRYVKGE